MTDNLITLDENNATVKAVITQIRSDMRASGRYAAYVEEFGVTKETVKDHALALARLVTPETAQKKDGKRTRFGNAVQAAGNGLRSALGKDEKATEPGIIRVSLSGEGGGTVTIKPGDANYKAALVLLGNDVSNLSDAA